MSKSFLGKGWKFPVAVDMTTGRIKMSEQEEDIAEAIRLIIWTAKGERVMRPTFGCGIHSFMFELTDDTTLRLMESSILEAILEWEPRVHEVEVTASVDPSNRERVLLHVQYEVRSTNNLFNQVYPFYIHEGTG